MNTASIVQMPWNYCNVLRDGGKISKEHDTVERDDRWRFRVDSMQAFQEMMT